MSDIEIREAGSPFAAPDADIILRSVDGVNFRLHKSQLTRTLHGFDHILNTGELNGIGVAEETQDDLPVVPLPESSAVLDLFLRTLFPAELGCPTLSDNLNLMPGVCKALSKYCVRNMPAGVRDGLLLASVQRPEFVYAITCPYESLADVTKVAAKNTLPNACRLDSLSAEVVAEISGLQYHALAQYQVACRAAAISACAMERVKTLVSETPGLSTVGDPPKQCKCCITYRTVDLYRVCGPLNDPVDYDIDPYPLPEWLYQYMEDVAKELRTSAKICGAVALNDGPMADAIGACKTCPVCGSDVAKFIRFAHSFEKWIDEAITEVKFEGNASAN